MPGVMRQRTGDANPVQVPVAAATVIDQGDLVCLVGGLVVPASSIAWDTNLAGTQQDVHDVFLGVALTSSRNGDTADVIVATEGEFEFPCAAAAFALGALVGPTAISTTSANARQVVGVASPWLAVGRVSRVAPSGSTSVLVRIESTIMHGGVQAMAAP